jgi:hypothetical protein
MDDARFAVGDHAEVELVGKRRRIPELEQRPGQRDGEDVFFYEARRLASAGIGFRNHVLEHFALWHRSSAVRHRVPHLSTPLP